MRQILNYFNYINDYKNYTSKYPNRTDSQISLANSLNSSDYNEDHRGQNANGVDQQDNSQHRWLSTLNIRQFMAKKLTEQIPESITGNKRQRKRLKQKKYDQKRSKKNGEEFSGSKHRADQFLLNNTNQRRITNIYQREFVSFRLLFIICFCCQITSTSFFRLIEANYLKGPKSVLKAVIREQLHQQIQDQQTMAPDVKPQFLSHHRRHQPHQIYDETALINRQTLYNSDNKNINMNNNHNHNDNNNLDLSIMMSDHGTEALKLLNNTKTDSLANENTKWNSSSSIDDQALRMETAKKIKQIHSGKNIGKKSGKIFNVDAFLPPGYDKLMPPKENGKPTVVRFHVWVLGLDSIDEGSMTYVADIFMSQSWKDNRLVIPEDIEFNVNTTSNPRGAYRLLPLTLIDKIWRPDSFFKNAKEVTFQEMTIPNHYIWLYSDNTILYMVKLTLLLSCAMKFQTYPHDTQNCTMKIESLSYTTNDLVFDWEESDPLVVEEHIELPQHDLIRKDIDYCTTYYSSGTFTCVQVIFTIKRRLGYYIFHTYIPTCLIVIMSWISFWIKPEAVPARVTLCVTSLLTLSTQHAQSQKSLPPVSYIKAIDIFMSSCTVFVFASLMEYALVNILMSDELLTGWIGITPTAYQEPGRTLMMETQPAAAKSPVKFTSNPANRSISERSTVPNIINTCSSGSNLQLRYHSLTQLDALRFDDNEREHQYCSVNNKVQRMDNLQTLEIKQPRCAKQNNEYEYHFGDNIHHEIIINDQLPQSILRHRNCSSINNNNNNDNQEMKFRKNYAEEPAMMNSKKNKRSKTSKKNNQRENNNEKYFTKTQNLYPKHQRAYTVDHISRWTFPLSFVMLNLVYWTYYLEMLDSLGITQLVANV